MDELLKIFNDANVRYVLISGVHLLSAKEAANRPQDQSDIQFLHELRRVEALK